HDEYAGLDVAKGGPGSFFIDLDGDFVPDWPFSLEDLLDVLNLPDGSGQDNEIMYFAHLNENGGLTAFDSMGNYPNLILQGDTTWNSSGVSGSCLSFDGKGDLATMADPSPDYPALNDLFGTSNNAFVVSAWIKPMNLTSSANEHDTRNCFFSKGNTIRETAFSQKETLNWA
ncbi:MAG: hypothetical protein ACTSRI_21145, partial [Promethearchaeota archaeon]